MNYLLLLYRNAALKQCSMNSLSSVSRMENENNSFIGFISSFSGIFPLALEVFRYLCASQENQKWQLAITKHN